VRAARDAAAVERALADLGAAAAGDANVMEPLLAAARAHASEGEMVAALQAVWGDYTESPVI
jgi:methylmalonyl-CoA mutase N-terminal domain/subunit